MRKLWWSLIAWRRGAPTCRDCGRPKGERAGYYGYVCNWCSDRWAAEMRRRREGKAT